MAVGGQDQPRAENKTKQNGLPLWKANVLVFSFLFVLIVVLFFFQMEEMRRAFLEDQMTHAKILSSVFRLHVENAIESQRITHSIVKRLLLNIGSFIDYLDGFEPFSPQELEGFSKRLGLYGIAILRGPDSVISSVKAWSKAVPYECNETSEESLVLDRKNHLFVLSIRRHYGEGCVVCALHAKDFERLQDKIGLVAVVKALEQVDGVLFIDVDSGRIPKIEVRPELSSSLVSVRIPIGDRVLKVCLDASLYSDTIKRLWRNFLTMSLFLLISGGVLSYWLYLIQRRAMMRAVEMEKALGKQREEAMIGRAAATIAHEVRNPLNAIHMGLQRILLESDYLREEERRMIEISLESVKRVNGIVSDLLSFSRPIILKTGPVDICKVLEEMMIFLNLERKGIRVTRACKEAPIVIEADEGLIKQLFLNLLKNALEAQPRGGFLDIDVERDGDGVAITLRNGGKVPSEDEIERILEPYFTMKTKGSGIGLPFSRRIVLAHSGRFSVASKNGVFEVRIWLPRKGGRKT